jgi:pyruvate/2-oxoglutarate dehydrogenase complex dihydrolipoamide acyltransferase (E2) component
MPKVSVFIPQIGEGLQEARVVAFLKNPGDRVRRDEPIYQMETDKAVMDVESPVEGVLVAWSGKVDDILAIGAEIAVFEVSDGTEAPPAPHHAPSASTVERAPSAPAPQAVSATEASLYVPQIGEGLQEARIVAFLKQPGELIKRDEAIYQMETDKAVMDVESPYGGTLLRWSANVDDVLAIGAEVGVIKVSEGTEIQSAPSHGAPSDGPTIAVAVPSSPAASSGASITGLQGIPPRTRAYAKEKGLSTDVLLSIRPAGTKMMPSDIDAHLNKAKPQGYSEIQLGGKQRVLNSRMVRSNSLVVPGTMTVVCSWSPIEEARAKIKAGGGEFQPSAFTMFAYSVAKAISEFPTFRSAMIGDDKVRTYDNVSLGIAVALPGDELVLAVVDKADTLEWRSFADATRERIALARGGKDQAHEAVSVSLTNMQSAGLRNAIPVVVAPSMATIFLGEVFYDWNPNGTRRKVVNLTMTFDHRLANGMGAAEFLNKIKEYSENIEALIG